MNRIGIGLLATTFLGFVGCGSVDISSIKDFESLRGVVEQAVESQTKVSPDQVLTDLQQCEEDLKKLYKGLSRKNAQRTLDRVSEAIEHIQGGSAKLGALPDVPANVSQEAQMVSLRSHYFASMMIPTLRKSVAKQATQVIKTRPQSGDAAIARVLRFCSKLDLTQEITPRTLRAVGQGARTFSKRAQGVALYAMVAQAYWKYGQKESAEKILKAGISQYRDYKEKMPLVNQMIDQGHREPPNKGRICQEAFQRSLRAQESSLSRPAGKS